MIKHSKESVTFIECTSELGAGTRGSSLGIDALKTASRDAKLHLFSQYDSVVMKNENFLLDSPRSSDSFAKNIDPIARRLQQNASVISELYTRKRFPIVLSADHSNAAGFIQGTLRSFPDDRIGVIWIDAHADLHSPYTSPSGNMHGMSLSIASASNNLDCKRNELDESTQRKWKEILSKQNEVLELSDIAFIGLRSVEAEEQYLIDNFVGHNLTVESYRKFTSTEFVQSVKNQLNKCDKVYLSLDVDSMDPQLVSDGTGTPVAGGFSVDEIKKMILTLMGSIEICCFEITEINPTLDSKRNKMAESALEILQSVLDFNFET